MAFEQARGILDRAVADGAFPAAVAEVGTAASVDWRYAVGRLTYDAEASPVSVHTVFDLASLTKVLVSTTLAMQLVERGRLELDDPVGRWLSCWRGDERTSVTVGDLLAHEGGLAGWLPLFESCRGRVEFEAAIAALPLEYAPRSQSVYSDLGFVLLGFILEDAGGASLATQLADRIVPTLTAAGPGDGWRGPAGARITGPPLLFNPPSAWRPIIAPTEVEPWRGRLLVGEVHDNNAWALGGEAGHAGLFGSAPAVGAFARALLRSLTPEGTAGPVLSSSGIVGRFTRRVGTPGSSRALGWDTMLPTSSCGTRLSARSVGHVGFTGTSLWIDLERAVYVVLLTNRVHPTSRNDAIRSVRPAFHDAVVADL